jgi:serine/threonine-protein kinase
LPEKADTRDTGAQRRRYHLRALIGCGAFGEVYLAEQDSGAGFRRKVAVKVLNADMSQMREASVRIRDEARILGRLSHRNIVAVSDLCKLDDRWAVIMDYVPGSDLEQVIEALAAAGEMFPAAAALEVGAAVASALDAAHHATDDNNVPLAVIHRDIKPSNVRLSPDGEVKVLDFGVARVDMDTREARTRAQGMIGTERYMAPERILLEGDTPAGDVYAAAATVVELLGLEPLGRTPVLGDRHTAFVDAALDAVRGRLIGPDAVAEEVLALLRSALSHVPGDRPTAATMAETLARLARRLDDEALGTFARRFVPRVDGILGRTVAPVTGVLAEDVGASINPEPPSNATLAQFANVPTGAPTPARARGGRALLLWLGGLAASALVGAVLLAAIALRPSDPPANVEPAASVVSAPPAPELPAAPPAPVEVAAPEPPPVAVAMPSPAPAAQRIPVPAPAPVEPAPRVAGPIVEKALVALRDASSLEVRCGDAVTAGTAAVRLRDMPAGPCDIVATWLGQRLTTRIELDRPREFQCSVTDGVLRCS